MGRQACREVLKVGGRIVRVYVQHGDSKDISQIKGQFSKFSFIELSADQLNSLCNSTSHQGIAVELKERGYEDLGDFLKRSKSFEQSLVLVLDEIQDPQNFGTLLRASECFGVDAVICSKNRSPGITAVVTKSSVGASELVNLIPVSNIHQAVLALKKADYWTVASTLREDSKPLDTFDFPQRTACLIGAEGDGLHQLVEREADFPVQIQQFGSIQSLNVSQATSIFLYEYRRRFPKAT